MPIDTVPVLFYVVFVAPGFVAVMTVISSAAIEKDYSAFTLLVWSLVASLVIDTLFIAYYQWANTPIESFDQFTGILFDPYLRFDYVLGILGFSVLVGVVASIGILADVPGRMRRALQAKSRVQVNPRQPWSNFIRDAQILRIITNHGEIYRGFVSEWSRAGRPKEVRLEKVQRLDQEDQEYVPIDREILFLEKDIDRLLMLKEDDRPSIWERIKARIMDQQEEEDDEDDADTETEQAEAEITD